MERIRELSKLLDGYKLRNLEVLTNPSNTPNPTRYRQAYEAYKAGKWATEEELAELLELEIEGRPFRRFKFEFLKRLYLPVLFIDHEVETLNETQQQHMWCWKQLALFKTLLHRGAIKSATAIAHRLFEVADEYNFPLAGLETATFLKKHYALHEMDREKYQRYQAAAKKYELYFWAENKAAELYQLLLMPVAKSKSYQKNQAEEAARYREELQPYYDKGCDTQPFLGIFFAISCMEKMFKNRWKESIILCDEAILKITENKNYSNRILSIIIGYKVICLTRIGEFKEAEILILKESKIESLGNSYWYRIHELYIYVAFQASNFEKAYEIYSTAVNLKEYDLLPSEQKEAWQLFFAYLALSFNIGKLKLSNNNEINKFKLSKFLNGVPTFSQDKQGLNIPVLIIQVIFLLQKKEYDKIEERIEALRKYRVRHLFTVENSRSNCFIKILQVLTKADFRLEQFKILSKDLWEDLLRIPLSKALQRHEIEIISYEVLYSWVLELLI
jgi:hypothetical protein